MGKTLKDANITLANKLITHVTLPVYCPQISFDQIHQSANTNNRTLSVG